MNARHSPAKFKHGNDVRLVIVTESFDRWRTVSGYDVRQFGP